MPSSFDADVRASRREMMAAEPRRQRERAVRRLVRAMVIRGLAANGVAVAMVATVTGVTARAYFGHEASSRIAETNLRLLVPQSLVAVIGAWLYARWIIRRRMAWFLDGRPASSEESDRLSALPLFLAAVINLVAWTTFETTYVLYVIHVEHIGWPALALAKELSANFFGLIMGSALTYLLVERALRPYMRMILTPDIATWPRPTGLGPRLIVVWFTVAGAPLLLIAFTSMGLNADQRGLVVPGLRILSVFAAILGLVTFVIAGRTITVPLRKLQGALRRVSAGDLTAQVEIDEAAEIGHLEAGFNNMVQGLVTLQSDNAQLQDELRRQLEAVRESRIRIVEAADSERARIERNLHDGAQQRLLSLSFALRGVERSVRDGRGDAEEGVRAALAELDAAMSELRELARGIHPAILDEEGLGAALSSLAERAPVPTEVTSTLNGRLPSAVEVTAYFVAAESLTNIAKYADASTATIAADVTDGVLHLQVSDDGKGGADPQLGSGLRGLSDRISALGGVFSVDSREGAGTTVNARIPCA